MADLTERHIAEVGKTLLLPNVRGYSCTLQARIRGGRAIPEEKVIRIYVTEKVPLEALAAGQALPTEIEGIPVDVGAALVRRP